MKDFLAWIRIKITTHETKGTVFFHEREIWWCKLGVNVGYEIDGHGTAFERPVIVVKKFNLDTCLVVPLTAKQKKGKYYFPIGNASGREAVAVLSQLRMVDRRRFTEKAGTVPKDTFQNLLFAITDVDLSMTDKQSKNSPALSRGRAGRSRKC